MVTKATGATYSKYYQITLEIQLKMEKLLDAEAWLDFMSLTDTV
jgi:hypothetical protein